ncbi:Membrane protein [Mycena venus]|uniref:Membrane protein n=1 Tax=Mycena venus TaxID=2733690 RepID=A0A8H7DF20_9AGAR|nr:Membrane protein [Mycena venus]
MFFRFYNQPGRNLPQEKQRELRNELLTIAQTCLHPVPDYQCLSSRPDALENKLIVVAYNGTDPENDEAGTKEQPPSAVGFTSAMYLDVPDVEHAVLHTGLTVAVPAVQRTGILAHLFSQLFLHVMPLHPDGMWVTTLAAVLSSLVQSEKVLYNTYPCPATPENPSLSPPPATARAPGDRARN